MAFGTRLTLKPCRGARLALSVPLGYRLLMLCLGGMVLLFMALIPPTEAENLFVPANTAPLVICLLSFLIAAYHERWLFDKGADRLVYQIGLRFLHANRVYRRKGRRASSPGPSWSSPCRSRTARFSGWKTTAPSRKGGPSIPPGPSRSTAAFPWRTGRGGEA